MSSNFSAFNDFSSKNASAAAGFALVSRSDEFASLWRRLLLAFSDFSPVIACGNVEKNALVAAGFALASRLYEFAFANSS